MSDELAALSSQSQLQVARSEAEQQAHRQSHLSPDTCRLHHRYHAALGWPLRSAPDATLCKVAWTRASQLTGERAHHHRRAPSVACEPPPPSSGPARLPGRALTLDSALAGWRRAQLVGSPSGSSSVCSSQSSLCSSDSSAATCSLPFACSAPNSLCSPLAPPLGSSRSILESRLKQLDLADQLEPTSCGEADDDELALLDHQLLSLQDFRRARPQLAATNRRPPRGATRFATKAPAGMRAPAAFHSLLPAHECASSPYRLRPGQLPVASNASMSANCAQHSWSPVTPANFHLLYGPAESQSLGRAHRQHQPHYQPNESTCSCSSELDIHAQEGRRPAANQFRVPRQPADGCQQAAPGQTPASAASNQSDFQRGIPSPPPPPPSTAHSTSQPPQPLPLVHQSTYTKSATDTDTGTVASQHIRPLTGRLPTEQLKQRQAVSFRRSATAGEGQGCQALVYGGPSKHHKALARQRSANVVVSCSPKSPSQHCQPDRRQSASKRSPRRSDQAHSSASDYGQARPSSAAGAPKLEHIGSDPTGAHNTNSLQAQHYQTTLHQHQHMINPLAQQVLGESTGPLVAQAPVSTPVDFARLPPITSHRTNSPWMRLSSIILTPIGVVIILFIVVSPLLHYLM